MNAFKPLLKLEMGRVLFFIDGAMDVFKSLLRLLLKQTLKQMRRLYYFMIYPDIMGADPDAIEDPLRRGYIEDPLRREYIKEVKRLMVNGEPIPDFVRVSYDEEYPAVWVDTWTGRAKVTMEEILRNEKTMEYFREMEAMMDRMDKERERREKVQAGEGNGRSGRKSRTGAGSGRPGRKSQAGEGSGRPGRKSQAGEGISRPGRKSRAGEGNGRPGRKSQAGEESGGRRRKSQTGAGISGVRGKSQARKPISRH